MRQSKGNGHNDEGLISTYGTDEAGLLAVYFREITRYPLLTLEEEKNLARRKREGDEDALYELIRANLRFVITIARQYLNYGLSLADLISEGNLGLIEGVKRFDERRGVRLIAYASWWIRQKIGLALGDHSRITRIPMNLFVLIPKIIEADRQLLQELCRTPKPEEIAVKLNLSPEKVKDILGIAGHPIPLDWQPEKDEPAWVNSFPDGRIEPPDRNLEREKLREALNRVLMTLDEDERKILALRYGLEDDYSVSQEEIGTILNLTGARIGQIEREAIRRLRHSSRAKALRALSEYID